MLNFDYRLWKPKKTLKPLVYADGYDATIDPDALIVIPPRGYWSKNVTLDVKSTREALKYGEALLDLGAGYDYAAYKMGDNSFSIVGYKTQDLLQLWPDVFDAAHERHIVFAQWVFGTIAQPVLLPNGALLALCEGDVVEMQPQYVQAPHTTLLADALSVGRGDYPAISTFEFVASPLDIKTLWISVVILLVLLGNIGMGIVGVNQQRTHVEDQKTLLMQRTSLGETAIERLAVIGVMEEKQKRERKFKEQCYTLKAIEIDNDVPSSTPRIQPVAPSLTPSTLGGVVLIPGSKPSDKNQLIVNGTPAVSFATPKAMGIKELVFDGKGMVMSVVSSDPEGLQRAFLKQFKNSKTTIQGNNLEVRIK